MWSGCAPSPSWNSANAMCISMCTLRHLQAAMAAPLGAGAPQYSADGRAYDGMRPGMWRAHVELAGSVFDGRQVPSGLDGEWMSTPQLRCCQDLGYRVQVREGWYWQEAYDLLKSWGSTLWQAASRLHINAQAYRHARRANALHTITLLAELGISILGTGADTWGLVPA